MSDNVVEFPKPDTMFPASAEEAKQHLDQIRLEYCDEISSEIFEQVVNMMSQFGFRIKSVDSHLRDIVFLEETIKAFVYRYKNLNHQFHEMIDSAITLPTDQPEENKQQAEASNVE